MYCIFIKTYDNLVCIMAEKIFDCSIISAFDFKVRLFLGLRAISPPFLLDFWRVEKSKVFLAGILIQNLTH